MVWDYFWFAGLIALLVLPQAVVWLVARDRRARLLASREPMSVETLVLGLAPASELASLVSAWLDAAEILGIDPELVRADDPLDCLRGVPGWLETVIGFDADVRYLCKCSGLSAGRAAASQSHTFGDAVLAMCEGQSSAQR